MVEQVVAQVVLRGRDGSSIQETEEPTTPETAKRYKIDEERIRQVREKLLAFGFEVVAAGPYSLSIAGSSDLFERVFQTRLRLRQPSATGISVGSKAFYEAQDRITIPDELAPFVAAITLPKPPELFP